MYFPSPSFCWSPFSISIIFPYLSIIFAFDSSLLISFHRLSDLSFFQCPFHSVNSQSFTVDFPRCVVSEDLGGSAAKTGAAIPRSRNPIQQMCGSSGCGERWRKITLWKSSHIFSIYYIFSNLNLINLIHILTGKISAIHQLHLRSHHFTAVHSVHRQHRHLRFQSLRTRLHHPAARPQSCTKS